MFEDDGDFDLEDDFISSSFSTSRTNTPTFAFPELSSEFKRSGCKVSEPVKASISKQVFPNEYLERTHLNILATVQSPRKVVSGISPSDSGGYRETNGQWLISRPQTAGVLKRKNSEPAGVLSDKGQTVNIDQVYAKRKGPNTIHALQDDDEMCPPHSASVFDGGPWVQMLSDLNSTPSSEDSLTNRYNIRWIKHNANHRKLIDQKVPFLAAIIENINANSTLTSINLTLKDPTGEIDAALLHTLYHDYSDSLRIGAVIVLKRFGVFSTGSKHSLTITANNLVTIYLTDVGKNTEIDNSTGRNGESIIENACRNGRRTTIKRIIVQKMTKEDLVKEVNQVANQSLISSRALEGLHNLNKPSTLASQPKGQNPPEISNSVLKTNGRCSSSNVDINKSRLNTLKPSLMVTQHTTPATLKEKTVYSDNTLQRKRSKTILSLRSQCDISKNAADCYSFKHYRETVSSGFGVPQNKSFSDGKENLHVDTSKFKNMPSIFGTNDDLEDFTITEEFSNDVSFQIHSTTKGYIKNNRARSFEADVNQSIAEKMNNNMNFVTDTTTRSKGDFGGKHDKISFEDDVDLDLAISQEFSSDMQVETGSITGEYNTARNFELDEDLNLPIDKDCINRNLLTHNHVRIKGTLHNNRAKNFDRDINKIRIFEGESDLDWAISQQFNIDMECKRGNGSKEDFKSNRANIFEVDDTTNMNFAKGATTRALGNIQNNTTSVFEVDDVDLSINKECGTSMNFKTDIKPKAEIPNKRTKGEIRKTIPLANSRAIGDIENNGASYFEADDDVNLSINEEFGTSMDFKTDIKTKQEIPKKRATSEVRKTIPLANITSRCIRNSENNRTSYFEAVNDASYSINEEICTSTNFEMDVKTKGGSHKTAPSQCELVASKSRRIHFQNNKTNYFEADDVNFSLNEEFNATNFETNIKNKGEIQKERANNHESVAPKSDTKNSIPIVTSSDNVGLQMRASKVKSKLMKFRFKSRNKDAGENDEEKNKPKESLAFVAFVGQEKDHLQPSEESSVIMSNSQLSVKTTNIEHDEIWKNALGDIDTDALFEDF